MTGVLASFGRSLGRRMSAWSLTPSVDGIVASLHSAPSGTAPAAPAVAGRTAIAARANRMVRRVLMAAATQPPAISCCGRSAGAQQRPHVDLERGARAVRLDHPPAAPHERAPQPGLRQHGGAEAA